MIDPEELRRRRKERAHQRELARRRLLTRLIIGLVVAVAVVVGIILFTQLAGNSSPNEEQTTTVPETSAPDTSLPEQTAPPEKTTVIHFAATGDLNIFDRLMEAGSENAGYDQVFMDVAPLLAQADLTTINFEGNLCGAPYGASGSAPLSLVQSLKRAGVDLLQLANSYSIKQGIAGLRTTISATKNAGLLPVGVFADQNDYDQSRGFTLLNIQGVKVAVVAFTKGMDNTNIPPGNEHCVNLLYTDYSSTYQKVDKAGITKVLKAVSAEQPDITIALLHWGSEYNDTISSTQKTIVNLMQEQGVDAIIGTHPHWVQKIDYKADAGTLVAYSLGDFVSDVPRAGTEYSILLDLEITKDNETGKASITGFSYTPLFTVKEEGKPLRVVRIDEAMAAYEAGYMDRVSKETYDAMTYALARIEARVNGK
jgi:poly-gamma-glutamate synthesis protein (capsule biosynthesis protein)